MSFPIGFWPYRKLKALLCRKRPFRKRMPRVWRKAYARCESPFPAMHMPLWSPPLSVRRCCPANRILPEAQSHHRRIPFPSHPLPRTRPKTCWPAARCLLFVLARRAYALHQRRCLRPKSARRSCPLAFPYDRRIRSSASNRSDVRSSATESSHAPPWTPAPGHQGRPPPGAHRP